MAKSDRACYLKRAHFGGELAGHFFFHVKEQQYMSFQMLLVRDIFFFIYVISFSDMAGKVSQVWVHLK